MGVVAVVAGMMIALIGSPYIVKFLTWPLERAQLIEQVNTNPDKRAVPVKFGSGVVSHIRESDLKNLAEAGNLKGAFTMTKAFTRNFMKLRAGRIINVASVVGLVGNAGQANYAAAKLGILGLANALAEEGRTKNIHVNTIAPIAASRMTETVFPKELLDRLRPEAVSPLVGWLAHELCTETKGLFEVGAGYMAKLRWERTNGYRFGGDFTLDDVARHWDAVVDFTGAEHPVVMHDSLAAVQREG